MRGRQHDGPESSRAVRSPSSGCVSRTSTDEYLDHEPFDTFKEKVIRLCQKLWPTHGIDDFTVERIKGGSNNRIVGLRVQEGTALDDSSPGAPAASGLAEEPNDFIAVDKAQPNLQAKAKVPKASPDVIDEKQLPPGNYVLRIPRFGVQNFKHEETMLQYVQRRISFNVPEIVYCDTGIEDDNPLGSPFVLQRRIQGTRLDEAWEHLNQTQRLLVTMDMARLVSELRQVTNSSGGIPRFNSDCENHEALETVDFRFPADPPGLELRIPTGLPINMVRDRLIRWDTRFSRPRTNSVWADAVEVVEYLHAAHGTYGPPQPIYYLNHGDLFPRNIMVDVLDDWCATISGVLDWDDAHFAPAVVSFTPPAWLWIDRFWKDYSDADYIDEREIWDVAGNIPEEKHAKERKTLFDRIVGKQYLRYAYCVDASPARKTWQAAKETIGKSWVEKELEELASLHGCSNSCRLLRGYGKYTEDIPSF